MSNHFKINAFQISNNIFSTLQQSHVTPKIKIKKEIIYLMANIRSEGHLIYVNELINNNIVRNLDVKIIDDAENLYTELELVYNQGYRCALNDSNSQQTFNTFTWLKNHPDFTLISLASTVASDIFIENMPKNMIRTSLDDNILLQYLFTNIFPNLHQILKTGNHVEAKYFNATSEPFKKIVYIYTPTSYTIGYLEMLNKHSIIDVEDVLIPDLETFDYTYIQHLLSKNRLNSTNYNSEEKTLFIFNSTGGNDILNKIFELNEQNVDNVIMTTDAMDIPSLLTSKPFSCCFGAFGSYSAHGVKYTNLRSLKSLNPQIVYVIEILKSIENIYENYITNIKTNRNVGESFIFQLEDNGLCEINVWGEKSLIFINLDSDETVDAYYQTSMKSVSTYQNLNPITIASVIDSTMVSDITLLELTEHDSENYVKQSYEDNKQRIENLPGVDTLLDGEYTAFIDDITKRTWKNALKQHHKEFMSNILYAKWYVYSTLENANIPEINLETIYLERFLDIRESGYINTLMEPQPLTIPSSTMQCKAIYINMETNEYDPELTEDVEDTIIDEIILTDIRASVTNLSVDLYVGHIYLFFTYAENDEINVQKIVRGIVTQKFEIDNKIIDRNLTIGESIFHLPSSQNVTVTNISDDNYYIDVMKQDGSTISTNLNELQKLRILDQIKLKLDEAHNNFTYDMSSWLQLTYQEKSDIYKNYLQSSGYSDMDSIDYLIEDFFTNYGMPNSNI